MRGRRNPDDDQEPGKCNRREMADGGNKDVVADKKKKGKWKSNGDVQNETNEMGGGPNPR